MTYVVKGECVDCKHTTCVKVCPVDCFHEGENTVVIDPEVCIDCAICEPECPVNAIVSDRKLETESDLARNHKSKRSIAYIRTGGWLY